MARTKQVPLPQHMAAPTPTGAALSTAQATERQRYSEGKKGLKYEALAWDTPLPGMTEYLRHLYAEGRRVNYVPAVRLGLVHFTNFILLEHGKVISADQITRADLVRFKGYLTTLKNKYGEPYSRRYTIQLLKYVRGWLNYLVQEEILEETPWRNIKTGHVPKEPSPLSLEEVAQLFDAHRRQAFSIDPFMYHRREVILTLLLGWGLRIHELASLDVDRVDPRRDFVRVANKGGTVKDLPYNPEMKGVIVRYLSHRARRAAQGEPALLVDATNGVRLSDNSIRTVVQNLGESAGVPLKPHQLRDSFGTAMVNEHVPIEEIMSMMGHRNRAQTMQYVALSNPTIKESHSRVMGPLLSRLVGGEE